MKNPRDKAIRIRMLLLQYASRWVFEENKLRIWGFNFGYAEIELPAEIMRELRG